NLRRNPPDGQIRNQNPRFVMLNSYCPEQKSDEKFDFGYLRTVTRYVTSLPPSLIFWCFYKMLRFFSLFPVPPPAALEKEGGRSLPDPRAEALG
ncbi:hypothetical protein KKF97_14540, partial [Myxococcota bacterium]|nr:hypothetical protein [Myxococcota bacterium]